jgi:hypothetical protein
MSVNGLAEASVGSAQNSTPRLRSDKRLSPKQIAACRLLFEDRLTDEKISETLKISRTTLNRWKAIPMFDAELQRQRKTFANRVLNSGIALQANRVNERNQRHGLLKHIVQSRMKQADNDPELAAAGGRSGFVVRTDSKKTVRKSRCVPCKGTGDWHGNTCPHCGGSGTREVVEREAKYEPDIGLAAALSALEREQAQDLGQMGGDAEASGGRVQINIVFMADDPNNL